jgi:hypothetical protein
MEHERQGFGALPATLDDPPLNFSAGHPMKPVNEAPYLFKLELPSAPELDGLKPDAAGVAKFLTYLAAHKMVIPTPPPDVTLPDIPAPTLASPPLVLPTFRRGSMEFGVAMRVNTPADLYKTFDLSPNWKLKVEGPIGTAAAPPGFKLTFAGGKWNLMAENWESAAAAFLMLNVVRANLDGPMTLFDAGLLRMEVDDASAFARLNAPVGNGPPFSVGFKITGLRVKLGSEYLKLLKLSSPLEASLDLDTAYGRMADIRRKTLSLRRSSRHSWCFAVFLGV